MKNSIKTTTYNNISSEKRAPSATRRRLLLGLLASLTGWLGWPLLVRAAERLIHQAESQFNDALLVTEDEDGLVLKVDGRDEAGLLAEAIDRFFIRGVDASIVFDAGDGPAEAMVITLNGASARAVRVR